MKPIELDTRDKVRDRQKELLKAGFNPGPLDGFWGVKTQRAEDGYQASLKMKPQDTSTPPGSPQREVVLEGQQAVLLGQRIIAGAKHFVGLAETQNNARWDDLATAGADPQASELRLELIATGWQPGWAYCMAFVDVIWRRAYEHRPELADIIRLITPSVMETYENFRELGMITRDPIPGAIGLFRHGNTWQGHAVTLIEPIHGSRFETIEGNTNAAGSREGDGVWEKTRALEYDSSSFPLLGFVNPWVGTLKR